MRLESMRTRSCSAQILRYNKTCHNQLMTCGRYLNPETTADDEDYGYSLVDANCLEGRTTSRERLGGQAITSACCCQCRRRHWAGMVVTVNIDVAFRRSQSRRFPGMLQRIKQRAANTHPLKANGSRRTSTVLVFWPCTPWSNRSPVSQIALTSSADEIGHNMGADHVRIQLVGGS